MQRYAVDLEPVEFSGAMLFVHPREAGEWQSFGRVSSTRASSGPK
jgi:hypothetical protein